MTTTQVTYSHSDLVAMAAPSIKSLAAWIRKQDRWVAECEVFIHGDVSTRHLYAPNISHMPSKDSKHKAYGDAGYIMRLFPELGVERPSTVDGLRLVVTAAKRECGMR